MTENNTPEALPIGEPVCKPGEDFTEAVTIAEIGIVARQLGCNPIIEIEREGPQQWSAMARLGWVLDRRRNPQARHEVWDALTLGQLMRALGIPTGEVPADREARAAAAAEVDAADPTGGAHE